MKTEVWKIDPPKAAELLSSMTRNRSIAPLTVERYSRAMLAGRWRLNGQAVSVVENGDGTVHMVNGAHRMHAVIKSGTTQEFLVVYEADESVFDTFDIGRNRSTAAILSLNGQSNPAVVAAIARTLLFYSRSPGDLWNSRADVVMPDEVVAWFEALSPDEKGEITEAARMVSEVRYTVRSVGSWYGALVWLIRKESAQPDLLIPFHEAIRYGAGLPEGDPRLALRNWIINSVLRSGSAGDVTRQAALSVGIRAWNDWLAGERQQQYQFRAGRILNGKRIQSSLPMPSIR